MIQFEVGKTYYTRSAGDRNCIFRYTVISRTPKTVTMEDDFKKVRTCRIKEREGTEMVFPEGRYSLAPCIKATSDKELFPEWDRPKKQPANVEPFPAKEDKEEIEPGVFSEPPSSIHTSIYAAVKNCVTQQGDRLVPNLKALRNENALNLVTLTRMVGLYNSGQRWVEF